MKVTTRLTEAVAGEIFSKDGEGFGDFLRRVFGTYQSEIDPKTHKHYYLHNGTVYTDGPGDGSNRHQLVPTRMKSLPSIGKKEQDRRAWNTATTQRRA